ncbi:MAG: alpha-1,2-fucosyltransferase [Daejeonella sp.]|uniref:alpha-1,2-fucosyltransferase n=1 Tax=Daejeonella sp. TaxID=2805397 RepID=UPI003C75FEC9
MDEFNELPSNVLLEGYWQTEKYFLQIRPILLNEFRWEPFTDHLNPIVCESISKDNSVGLHVRRGDFIENAVIHNHHGVCDIDYYRRAISHVNANIENPTYYVFSDDIAWAKREFASLSSVKFIDHNKGSESFRDMQLMSYCKHNIIANSSFSWWGAWLNQNENKVVVAPEKWFKNLEMSTTDLIPSRWIKK